MNILRKSLLLSRVGVAAFACGIGFSAQSATYSCIGKVESVTVDPAGGVNATFVFENGIMSWQGVCSIDHAADNVSVSSCKGILGVLLTARTTNKRIQLWFDNAGGSCTATAWRPLRESGWYWGPALME